MMAYLGDMIYRKIKFEDKMEEFCAEFLIAAFYTIFYYMVVSSVVFFFKVLYFVLSLFPQIVAPLSIVFVLCAEDAHLDKRHLLLWASSLFAIAYDTGRLIKNNYTPVKYHRADHPIFSSLVYSFYWFYFCASFYFMKEICCETSHDANWPKVFYFAVCLASLSLMDTCRQVVYKAFFYNKELENSNNFLPFPYLAHKTLCIVAAGLVRMFLLFGLWRIYRELSLCDNYNVAEKLYNFSLF